jgi:hypothetical protein
MLYLLCANGIIYTGETWNSNPGVQYQKLLLSHILVLTQNEEGVCFSTCLILHPIDYKLW